MTSLGSKIGPYEITPEIGRGGMGVVYLAHDTKLDRDVAIKCLPDELSDDADRLSRFEREAKLLASLNHPNIASIYGLEVVDGKRYVILEYIEGETLEEKLRKGAIPVEEALPIAIQIAEAIEAAHEKGVIHRDLKPANIKFTKEEQVKVLDFGLAKAMDDQPMTGSELAKSPTIIAGNSPTLAGVVLGTAGYLSPEQARGRPVDKRTDIFAFGCVLFEMLTGEQLFAGETVSDSLASTLKSDPIWTTLPRPSCFCCAAVWPKIASAACMISPMPGWRSRMRSAIRRVRHSAWRPRRSPNLQPIIDRVDGSLRFCLSP